MSQNKHLIAKFCALILMIMKCVFTTQEDSCILNDGYTQSKCIYTHRCDIFQDVLIRYKARPPENMAQNIRTHFCQTPKFICCPHNATATPPDYNSLLTHKNIDLINHRFCGTSTTRRVAHGENGKGRNVENVHMGITFQKILAALNEFPWVALLGYEPLENTLEWRCGGSLISLRFVLTAAHCLKTDLKLVRLGELQISTKSDCDEDDYCTDPVQDILIEKAIRHPYYYGRINQMFDIALLKLSTAADLSKANVMTICLPVTAENDIEKLKSKTFIISGWGLTESGSSSDVLQKAYAPYVENDACINIFAPHEKIMIHSTYICAGGGENKTNTCKGDSGGAIVGAGLMNNKPTSILYGITSAGVGCIDSNLHFPGVYTNIRYYLQWILDNMS